MMLCVKIFYLVTKRNHPLSKYAEKVEGLDYPVIDLHLFKDENFVLLERDKRIRQICDSIFEELNFKPKIALLSGITKQHGGLQVWDSA